LALESMNEVHAVIVLLLLFMAVPDLCRKIRRPALIYSAYVVFGVVLGPLLHTDVGTMLAQAGNVGFLLLLFEVGMEIELPRLYRLVRSLRNALLLALLQVPLVLAVTHAAGYDLVQSLLAAAALTGCSVGMAYAAWKNYPGLSDLARKRLLRTMVALELWTILTLALGSGAIKEGVDLQFVSTLVAIVALMFLIVQMGPRLAPVFEWIITRTTHWRVHLLVLMILVVCSLGEWIGLDGPKTAFFLGLAMNQTRHRGMNLDEHMAPISQRFLIPIFFVALGLQIRWLDPVSLALAFGTAGLLLGLRMMIHNRLLKIGGDKNAFLLLSPNLTMVARGATALLQYAHADKAATWLLLTGLFMTIPSLLLLPAAGDTKAASPKPKPAPQPDAAVGATPEPSPSPTTGTESGGAAQALPGQPTSN
jgi:Kef-type K+ transport system membrane component KefB